MDKAEYQVKLEELKTLVAEQYYEDALNVVNEIDWKRVKNTRTLSMVADVYEANEMLEDCRRILLLALKRASVGKSILTRLTELSLEMNDTAAASEYFKEFVRVAPRDSARYLLQYKIYRANQAALEDQIDALQRYKDSEYTEKWAYELASLYDQAGMVNECVDECDDIILWFSDGIYVVKAMELKMKHTKLTPSQQDKYDHRFETMPELTAEETPRFPKRKKVKEPEAVSAEDGKSEGIVGDQAAVAEPKGELPEKSEKPEEPQEPEEFVSTIDLQSRLSSGLKKVIGSMIHEDIDAVEKQQEEEEFFAAAAEKRYAPKLEPEPMTTESSLRKVEDVKPEEEDEEGKEVKPEPVKGSETFNLASIFEAQADAMAQGKDFTKAGEEKAAEQAEKIMAESQPKDAFDLAGVLASQVADILRGGADEVKETVPQEPAEEINTEEPKAEDLPEIPDIVIEDPMDVIREMEEKDTEATSPVPEETIVFAKPVVEAVIEEPIKETEEISTEEASAPVTEEPAAEIPDIVIEAPEEVVQEMEEASEENGSEAANAGSLPETATTRDLSSADMQSDSKDADKETAENSENKEDDFDLQAILAAEVTGIMDNPEPEPEPEKDIIERLEEEAEKTIEHQELVRETPQEKRIRIMRAIPANRMTEEQKRVFTYFAKVPGMDTQILEAMNTAYNGAVLKTSARGNIAIMGRKGTGKTRLTEGLIKALCREFEMSAAKFARLKAEEFNTKDPAKVVDKLSGGFLVIEKASQMDDDIIEKLDQAMDFRTDSMIVIIEDEKDDMKAMFEKHPSFAEKFDAQIKIPVFTNDELVTFARTYASECGYKMDEMGILALYTIIGANQSIEEPVSIAKVKSMVDAAINKASKGGRRFGRKLSGRQVDRLNRIILYEKDFEL